jgi:hypothetical protein
MSGLSLSLSLSLACRWWLACGARMAGSRGGWCGPACDFKGPFQTQMNVKAALNSPLSLKYKTLAQLMYPLLKGLKCFIYLCTNPVSILSVPIQPAR